MENAKADKIRAARERLYDGLMTLNDMESLSNEAALEKIGLLVDLSGDLAREEGIGRALVWCDEFDRRGISGSDGALLEYFRANAWGNRQDMRHSDRESAWAWEQPDLQKQLLHLRRAVAHEGFEELPVLRRCQILTNLGNQLNSVGRFVEALEYWGRALTANPRFGMALGNRGVGLGRYARALYDRGHQKVFLKVAHKNLKAALSKSAEYEWPGYDQAKEAFETVKARIESVRGARSGSPGAEIDDRILGRSEKERHYRRWCLTNHLFLNPLNDLGAEPIGARDILVLPSFVAPIAEPPSLTGFFNQMKQEFVSARTMFYEGVHQKGVHFSDRAVLLYNTLDYPIYSLGLEKIKAAYRIRYSLFDKIAFFINDYLALRITPSAVSFRTIWYQHYDRRQLRQEFEYSANWPLRGLFWLSKDLFEEGFPRDVTEPDAQALHEIRTHLEHKYLKVHEMLIQRATDTASIDRLAYPVQRKDLLAKTFRVFRLARAGLIYLCLGMHREERRRSTERKQEVVVPMSLDVWEDDWKR
jgi:tetratricopeptide (TPR) repeat protein